MLISFIGFLSFNLKKNEYVTSVILNFIILIITTLKIEYDQPSLGKGIVKNTRVSVSYIHISFFIYFYLK